MRFKPVRRYPFTETSRKRVFLEKKLALACALDPWWVIDRKADAIMADRARRWSLREAEDRTLRAREWRRVRARYFAYSAAERAVLRVFWNEHRWLGGDPERLQGLLTSYDRGELTLTEMLQRLEGFRRLRDTSGPQSTRDVVPISLRPLSLLSRPTGR